MARVRSPWTPPSSDGGGNVQAGVALTPDVNISVSGVWWYQRVGGPANVRASLWNTSGQANLADSGSVSTVGFTASDWNLISFGSPATLTGGGTYVAAVLVNSVSSVGFDPDDLTSPIISADGHVTFPSGGGRFNTGTTFVYPASTWSGMHAVDIEYTLASTLTPTGISVPVALGSPTLTDGSMTLAPTGLSVPMALGSPTLTWSATIAPDGISVPVTLGAPSATIPGTRIPRPNTGIITRPNTGTVLRP